MNKCTRRMHIFCFLVPFQSFIAPKYFEEGNIRFSATNRKKIFKDTNPNSIALFIGQPASCDMKLCSNYIKACLPCATCQCHNVSSFQRARHNILSTINTSPNITTEDRIELNKNTTKKPSQQIVCMT